MEPIDSVELPVRILSTLRELERERARVEREYLARKRAVERPSDEAAREDPRRAAGSVLVVDDDETARAIARRALEAAGYAVAEAEDGADALVAIERARPDVVVLDLAMPRVGGVEVCRRLRAEGPLLGALPIIVVTAQRDPQAIQHVLAEGATDYLARPVDPAQLRARVAAAIALARSSERVDALRRSIDLFAPTA